jgi:hypothetical protein
MRRVEQGRWSGLVTRVGVMAIAAAVAVAPAAVALAQAGIGGGGMGGGGMGGGGMGGGGMGGGGMGGGGMGGGGMGGGGMGGMGGGGGLGSAAGAAGVVIDASGVLRTQRVADAGLSLARRRAAAASLPADLRTRSPLRKVALSRLEAEVARVAAAGGSIPDDLAKLAGLTRLQYVFVYPGDGSGPGEVVIAGPAEAWIADGTGRVVGVETGSPTLLLEDLAVAVRAFPPGQPSDRALGCSIDPTQEGLAALQTHLRKLGRINPQASVDQIVTGMRQALGPQMIRIDGVSPASHFAQVMVEADYRMKLIGIGMERAPVKMNTWIELASSSSVAANALQRWYFVPDYQCVRVSEDDMAIELVGRGVKLVGADEVVLPDGRRMSADRADRASKTFTDTFTKKYAEIAARTPVYSQLRTLIDLAVAAAYLQQHDAYGRTGWSATGLLDESVCPVEQLVPPSQVEPAVHAVWKGSRLLTPIGGGVTLEPRRALDPPNLIMDDEGTVGRAHAAATTLPAGRWWWD